MFFTEYDPLTEEYVLEKLRESPAAEGREPYGGPASFAFRSESPFAPDELRYEFGTDGALTCTENGETFTAPFSWAEKNGIGLLSHQVPGTDRAWHLILNLETCAATAFETWFGVTVPVGYDLTGQRPPSSYRDIPREVQRQYYLGWIDTGDNEKPAELMTTTSRIEGRGLHWQFEDGTEILTFYPSVVCCTVVELGEKAGGITVTQAADYLIINDETYVCARWEPEFSGKMHIDVMDFFDMDTFGLEYGFGEDNSLTYRFTHAVLELTGDAAHLEPITSAGDREQVFRGYGEKKGARYAYRPMDIDVPMKREEALACAAAKQDILAGTSVNIMQSYNHLPAVGDLAGRKFTILPDNERYAPAPWSGTGRNAASEGDPANAVEYEILSADRLRWRFKDGAWSEEKYACYRPDKDLYFFSHMMTGDPDLSCMSQVVDFRNGLTTTVIAGLGNWRSEWETGAQVFFGTLRYGDLKPPFARRHYFTDELVGKCFAWNYGETMQSIHIYSSPESYSWTIFQPNNAGGATWSSPCFYIKLRPEVYLLQWTEEKCNGCQGLVVFNRRILHDSGFFYGTSADGIRLQMTGAHMRELGSYDILKYFGRGIR